MVNETISVARTQTKSYSAAAFAQLRNFGYGYETRFKSSRNDMNQTFGRYMVRVVPKTNSQFFMASQQWLGWGKSKNPFKHHSVVYMVREERLLYKQHRNV